MLLRLTRILGKRSLITFGLVTFIVAAILAAVNLTSRHALKVYVEDQLSRTPWDLAVYQRGGAGASIVQAVRSKLTGVQGLRRIESMAFLRAQFPEGGEVTAEADGQRFVTPWLSLLAASDPTLLPPGLGVEVGKDGKMQGAVLALVGPERAMGPAFLALQGVKTFTMKVTMDEGEGENHGTVEHLLFNTPIQKVVRLDREELNRWLLEQTGSVSYIPHIGAILLVPFREDILSAFDTVAQGAVPASLAARQDADPGHVQIAEYYPEVMFLGRIDRPQLISGWDIAGSLERVISVNRAVRNATSTLVRLAEGGPEIRLARHEIDPNNINPEDEPEQLLGFAVDSTTAVLLGRMDRIARLLGAVSLLVALPLLWMSWVLAGNLAGLLMLNERRTLGLMRLRGIPGALIGRALLVAIFVGGLLGGVLGLLAGSFGPLAFYEGAKWSPEALLQPTQIWYSVAYLVVSMLVGLVVSRRLVKYATTISPLEASRRVAASEVTRTSLSFGVLQLLALLAGLYTLVGRWMLGWRLGDGSQSSALTWASWGLDFLGLPLFLYGVATLLASRRNVVQSVVGPLVRPFTGTVGRFAVQHMAAKPHRTAAFMLIVALMASLSIYPTITSTSFADRAERGAHVQLGADWQIVFNAPEFADVNDLKGALSGQVSALKPGIDRVMAALAKVPGVQRSTYMLEGVLPNFYLPGYGLRGVPMFFIADAGTYLQDVYSEPEVGITGTFDAVMRPIADGKIAASAPVADFWRLTPGANVLVGMDVDRRALGATTSGVLAYLPGMPPRSVTDRQGYVQARIDYLNHLFTRNAYLVASATHPQLARMEVLIPRVIVLVSTVPGTSPEELRKAMAAALPVPALEMHHLDAEVAKVGTDMYIALALANMRIYLAGGLILALVSILSIALVNYREDRRTLALLRIRGASPTELRHFFTATLLSPGFLGLVVGTLTALVAGFGLATYVWQLREIRTVVQLLPTRLVVSTVSVGVLLLLAGLLSAAAVGFSRWVYQRTARQTVQEA